MKTKTPPVKNDIVKKQINWLMGILVLLSVFAISIRMTLVGTEPLAGGDQLWKLNISFSTTAASDRATLHIYPPIDTAHIRTVQRNISHLGFKVSTSNNEKAKSYLQATANKAGKHSISSEYLLHLSQTPFSLAPKKEVSLSTEQRENYLQDDENLQITSPLVQKTLKKILIHRVEPDQIINELYALLKNIPASTKTDILNVPDILRRNKATILDRSLAMVSLIRAAGIPARLVSGIILKDDIDPSVHYWVQVFQNNQWVPYDPHYGYEHSLPINYLPLHRNGKDIVQVIHGELGRINFVLDQEYDHPYLNNSSEITLLSIFNLTRLPLDVRNELALLLLLPLGALLTALFRHLVGVHSYGVFTPTLLALAIVYTNLATTLVIFLVVSFLAVWGRSIFPATITRVPRLSIIFTLIAIILALSVSVLSYFDINQEGKVILLPIIILTSLVDRFYRTIEEKGITIAMRRMVWTILIALICLPVIRFEDLGHLILRYPEVHFITLALFLLISIYKGKKFIHLPVLKFFAEPESDKKKKKADDEE